MVGGNPVVGRTHTCRGDGATDRPRDCLGFVRFWTAATISGFGTYVTTLAILERTSGEYEVDHLVAFEDGGSNDIANLWPEAAEPRPGFHEKDQVENYLHDQVCTGRMNLFDAQSAIATDWLQVYLGSRQPGLPVVAPTTAAVPLPQPAPASGAVQISAVSGVAPGVRATVSATTTP